MKLIVDGYNLLFADKTLRGNLNGNGPVRDKRISGITLRPNQTQFRNELEEARENLINLIESYNRSRKDEITIVFDGITNSSRRNKTLSQPDYIKIIFSGDKENADDLIIQMAQREPNPRRVFVITSDNYIKDHVKPTGATIIDSISFINKLGISSDDSKKSSAHPEPNEKLYGISPAEAEKWLELFGIENEE